MAIIKMIIFINVYPVKKIHTNMENKIVIIHSNYLNIIYLMKLYLLNVPTIVMNV